MTLIEENQRLSAEVEKLQADFNRLAEQTTDVWVVEAQSGDKWIPAEYRNDKPHSYCERFSILLQAPHWRWRNTLTGQIETSGSYCFPDPKAEMEKDLEQLRENYDSVSRDYLAVCKQANNWARKNYLQEQEIKKLTYESQALKKELRRASEENTRLSAQALDWTLYKGDEITAPKDREKVVLWSPGVFDTVTAVVDARVFTTDYNNPATHNPYWRFRDGSKVDMQSYVDMWTPIPEYEA